MTTPTLIQDPDFPRLKGFLIENTGLAYYQHKDDDLAYRIQRRFAASTVSDCDSYLRLLQDGEAGEAELDLLIAELTIGETYFFRNREQFSALQNVVLPEIIRKNRKHRRLRIWSAGCATGAEPYSISILLKREFSHLLSGWQVSILGTDINRRFLGQAYEGKFKEWAFRSMPPEILTSCFTVSEKVWTIKPLYKEWVSFLYHNLVSHPFPSLVNNLVSFDLILCRNVMIYFDSDLITKLGAQFYETLVEGGWLLVGHADGNMQYFKSFRSINTGGTTLYQKDNTHKPPKRFSFDKCAEQQVAPISFDVYPVSPATLPQGVGEPFAAFVDFDLPEVGNPALPKAQKVQNGSPAVVHEPGLVQNEVTKIRDLANCGEYEKASSACEIISKSDILNPVPYFYHALVLEQMGKQAEAEQLLRKAIYLDRDFVFAHYHLGLLMLKNGKSADASRCFTNVLKLLAAFDDDFQFREWDSISVQELTKLTNMHLEVAKIHERK